MKKLLFVLLSASILVSCGKEDVTPETIPLATYKSVKYYSTSPVLMYTSDGEVRNQARANAFAKRHSRWYFLESQEEPATTDYFIKMLSAEAAETSNNGEVSSFDVQQDGEMLVFTSKAERTVTAPTHFGNVLYAISKYKPIVTDKQDLASGNGYSYKTKDRFYAQLKNDELQLLRMFITLKSPNGSIITTGPANVFDPAGVSVLQPGDTLIVQSFINAAIKQ